MGRLDKFEPLVLMALASVISQFVVVRLTLGRQVVVHERVHDQLARLKNGHPRATPAATGTLTFSS